MDIAGAKKDTQEEIQRRIAELEAKGDFGANVQPIDYNAMAPVTADYDFLPRNPAFLLWRAAVRTVASVFGPVATFFVMGGRVEGRKNLRGIKGFVAVCNHVHTLDNMLVRQAVFGHTLYIAVSEFNNMRGFLGNVIRGAGTLPFSSNIKAMMNLQKTFTHLLSKHCAILGYPEQSLWYRYEKPRPLYSGMFYIAAKNNAPVVPMFITFTKPSKLRSLFSKKKCATLHILKPIFPDKNLSRKENIARMMKACAAAWQACYDEVYSEYGK